MKSLSPYLATSLLLHVAAIVCVVPHPKKIESQLLSPQTSNVPMMLTLVGNPFPSRSAIPQPPSLPEKKSPHPEIIEDRCIAPILRQTKPAESALKSESAPASLSFAPGNSGASTRSSFSGELDAYLGAIRKRIEQYKKYPATAWRAGEEGFITFNLTINARGGVEHLELVAHEGSSRLQQAARKAIEEAAPFQQPPSKWANGLKVLVPIRFQVTENL